jgi:prepilin-type N-terminal cleavage/methylation domain-containing protein
MRNERGFTLIELLVSTTITLMVLAGAMSAFKDALDLNQAGSLVADSTQNLRAATNLIVRDLMQAGRGIPTGGLPIPSGAGTAPINRPGPIGSAYTFDNVNFTTLPAVVPGSALGPVIDGQVTDIVTVLMTDPTLAPLTLNPVPAVAGQATLAADGSSFDVGASTALITNPASGLKAGDLIMFTNALGTAVQMVTGTDGASVVFFNVNDALQLNQRGAAQGSITQIIPAPIPQTTAQRVLMVTYYVDNVSTPGVPRLARRINAAAGQALAGVVEDLDLTFDLVDGVNNPVNQKGVPVTVGGILYTPNQIRKINLHVGVRSEDVSLRQHDFVRNHLNTVISVRSLAYVDRYQ